MRSLGHSGDVRTCVSVQASWARQHAVRYCDWFVAPLAPPVIIAVDTTGTSNSTKMATILVDYWRVKLVRAIREKNWRVHQWDARIARLSCAAQKIIGCASAIARRTLK